MSSPLTIVTESAPITIEILGAQGTSGVTPNGTGLVSVTLGLLDTPMTLADRVTADAVNLRSHLGLGNSATRDFGVVANTVAAGDDTRFTNSRTPTAHKNTHSTGGSDALAPSDIGAATASQGSKADSALQAAALNNTALTGIPTVPTAADGNNSSQAASTAFVHAAVAFGSNTYSAGTGITLTGSVFSVGANSITNDRLATNPLARVNHTGTQAESTITGLVEDLSNKSNVGHTHTRS